MIFNGQSRSKKLSIRCKVTICKQFLIFLCCGKCSGKNCKCKLPKKFVHTDKYQIAVLMHEFEFASCECSNQHFSNPVKSKTIRALPAVGNTARQSEEKNAHICSHAFYPPNHILTKRVRKKKTSGMQNKEIYTSFRKWQNLQYCSLHFFSLLKHAM